MAATGGRGLAVSAPLGRAGRCSVVHVGNPSTPCVKPRGHYPVMPAQQQGPLQLWRPDETLWHQDATGFRWAEPDSQSAPRWP